MIAWGAAVLVLFAAGPEPAPRSVVVGPARFTPLFAAPKGARDPAPGARTEAVLVPAFRLDVTPVTNAEFLRFVTDQARWRRGTVKGIFADDGYLTHWHDPLALGPRARADGPVTRVSWYAAKAYCAWRGGRLPTALEWDLAAAASATAWDARSDAALNDQMRAWYARPTPEVLPAVGGGAPNRWGVRDLVGLVWEWVWDFNGALVTGDDRDRDGADRNAFCGAGAQASTNPADWASFMRAGFRSSLEARFTVRSLGFRCAYPAEDARR